MEAETRALLSSWWPARRWHVTAFVALMLADALTTIWITSQGLGTEANPMVRPFLGDPEGQAAFIVLKALGGAFVAYCSYFAFREAQTHKGRRGRIALGVECTMWVAFLGLMIVVDINNAWVIMKIHY